MARSILIIILLLIKASTYAQIGINTVDPKATLDITYSSSTSSPNGLLVPRMTAAELEANIADYGEAQNGTLIYIIGGIGTQSKTNDIQSVGFYHYDASIEKWMLNDTEPWIAAETNTQARSNNENIYQTGAVGIGSSTIDPSAQLDVSSSNKGILIPRLTTSERNAISATAANGLMIFNTDTNCLNYWNANISQWLSLCGTYGPAEFDFFNCDPPVGPSGSLTQGVNLGLNNSSYTIAVNVTEIGTYTILLSTTNGYSFSKNGVFTQTGTQTLVLEGQGTPINPTSPSTLDAVTVKFNGIDVVPNCPLPNITVLPASTSFTLVCDPGIIANGVYKNLIPMNNTNYIDFNIIGITGGNILINTNTVNGVTFSSNSTVIAPGNGTLRLFAQGVGSLVGDYTFTFTYPNGTPTPGTCSFTIAFGNSMGTFENPGRTCAAILTNGAAPDGYYWLQLSGSAKHKTYCDMSNGGWTLISSESERQILSTAYANYSRRFYSAYNTGVGNVTTQTGVFNEYNFRLPKNVIQSASKTPSVSNPLEFRFTIKQAGHTGNTLTAVENSTVAPINDLWTTENFMNVTITGSLNPFTYSAWASNGGSTGRNVLNGKIFNLPFIKAVATSELYSFNGAANTSPPGFYSAFFTGFYGTIGWAGNGALTYTYTGYNAGNGTYSFNRTNINDLFGPYGPEDQLNHHIGKCSGSDYGGVASCRNFVPHSFNGGEGRILQIWVK